MAKGDDDDYSDGATGNKVDDDMATARWVTMTMATTMATRQAMAQRDTMTTTMATGDDKDGATTTAMTMMATLRWATGYDDDGDDDQRRRPTTRSMAMERWAMDDEVDDDGDDDDYGDGRQRR